MLETELPIEATSDRLLVNDEGKIILVSYWHSRILMFNKDGSFKQVIANPGDGPGEVREPYFALPLEQSKKGEKFKGLVVFEGGQPRAHVFDLSTGAFIKQVRGFPMANKWATNGTSLVSLHNGVTSSKLWYVHNKDLKVELKFGNKEQIPRFEFLSRRFAMTYDAKGTVYYQEGSQPEIQVYKQGQDSSTRWRLKVPRHYREFKDSLDIRKAGINRNKAVEHMKSFTHLNGLMIVQNNLMIVEWLIWEPMLKSFDIYDLETRRLLCSGLTSDADLSTSADGKLYLLDAADEDEKESKHQLVVYNLQGLRNNFSVYASSQTRSSVRR